MERCSPGIPLIFQHANVDDSSKGKSWPLWPLWRVPGRRANWSYTISSLGSLLVEANPLGHWRSNLCPANWGGFPRSQPVVLRLRLGVFVILGPKSMGKAWQGPKNLQIGIVKCPDCSIMLHPHVGARLDKSDCWIDLKPAIHPDGYWLINLIGPPRLMVGKSD
jgi:hypothetical protein